MKSFLDNKNKIFATQLINSIPDYAVIINSEGEIQVKSDDWPDFLEKNIQNHKSTENDNNIYKIIDSINTSPDNINRIKSGLETVINNKTDFSLEYSIDNNKKFKIKINPFLSGALLIFEELKAKGELKKTKELLENLLNQSPGMTYQFQVFPDGSSSFPYASKGIGKIYEVSPEVAREDANKVYDRIHPEDYGKILKSIEYSAQNLTEWVEEYRVILPERGLRWLEGNATPEKLGNGSIIWHGYIKDITERKQMEEKLKLKEKQYRTIFEESLIGLEIIDSTGEIIDANKEVVKIQGYKREELIGKSLFEVIPKSLESKAKKNISEILNGKDKTYTTKSIRKDGEEYYLDLKETRIKIPDKGFGVLSMQTDISDKINAQKKMENAIKELDSQFEKAKKLHSKLLPLKLPEVEGYELETYYQPANRLGGDFYDFIELKDHLIFYVSDVSGHDLSSSMVNIFLKESINSYVTNLDLLLYKDANKNLSPKEIISHVRTQFQDAHFPSDYFITLLMGVLNKKTDEIKICNAGSHMSPIILNSNHGVSLLPVHGEPIIAYLSMAIELAVNYKEVTLKLDKNDSLILLTDGIIEQMNSNTKKEYGEERLYKLLANHIDNTPAEIIEILKSDFNDFKGETELQDDITKLIIKRLK